MKDKYLYWGDDWNEDIPSNLIKKKKRINNEFKQRDKAKDNKGRSQGGGAIDKGSGGSDY